MYNASTSPGLKVACLAGLMFFVVIANREVIF